MRRIEGRSRTVEGRRLYWVWSSMIQRCHNPKNAGYANYGAKGITVCPRWRYSFENFSGDMGARPAGASIERIDASRGYGPSNCKWASRLEQNRNRPSFCLYVDGVSLHKVWDLRAHPSVSYRNFRKRLRLRGWSIEEALARPERGKGELHGYRRTAA